MTKYPTVELADFASMVRYDDIPKEVRNKIKLLCLDAIGCALGSTKYNEIAKLINAIREFDNGNLGSIWGSDAKASISNAAMANGTMTHFLELDDVHKGSLMHPAASIVPSVLGACERVETNGRNFLTSLVVGYEVAVRVGMAVGPISHRERGWHATGTCGIFGAAVAAGKVLNLSTKEMSWALGLAGIQPTGTWAFAEEGSMNKPFHAGRASQGGIIAAFLAKQGFTGPTNILEATDGGFIKAVSDEFDLSKLTDNLGKKFEALDSFPKIFPCCTYQHAPLYATLKILKEHKITHEDVEKIVVKTSRVAKDSVARIQEPRSVVEAQFSLPYGIAVCIFDKEASLNQFSSERIRDRKVMELAKKVDVIVDQEIDREFPQKFPAEVQIVTKNGDIYSRYVSGPPGDSDNPISKDAIEKKFSELSSRAISTESIKQIIEFFRTIESQRNVANIMSILSINGETLPSRSVPS